MAGDDDDRKPVGHLGNPLLDLEAVQAGHMKIQNDTIGPTAVERGEKVLPRGNAFGLNVEDLQDALQRTTHRGIVVDYGNADWVRLHNRTA